MTFDYTTLATTAADLILQFGGGAVYRALPADVAGDNELIYADADPVSVRALLLDRKQEPGDNGQRTTARALMASTVVTTAPEPGATLTMGGLTWTIGEAEIVGPNGSAILYKLALWHG